MGFGALFAASFSEEEFRSIFEEKLKQIGLWRFACILTRTAEKYLGCSKRAWTEERGVFRNKAEVDELVRAVIRDVFTGGNFGRRQESRVYETYLISRRGKDGVGRTSMFVQTVKSVNEMVYTHWPLAKRMKLFLPAGWAYYCTRYLIRIATGKRGAAASQGAWRTCKRAEKRVREVWIVRDRGIGFCISAVEE